MNTSVSNTRIVFFSRNKVLSRKYVDSLRKVGFEVKDTYSIKDMRDAGRSVAPQLVIVEYLGNTVETRSVLKMMKEESAFLGSIVIFLAWRSLAISSQNKSTSIESSNNKNGLIRVVRSSDSISDFLVQVRSALRARTISSYQFDIQAPQKVQVQLKGAITHTNEVGFGISVPIKIASMSLLEVTSLQFDKLGLNQCSFQRTSCKSKDVDDQAFINEISVVGISPSAAEKLRVINH
jgi:hypothetical protein